MSVRNIFLTFVLCAVAVCASAAEWSQVKLKTGDVPAGFKVKPLLDKKINTWFAVRLGGSTDAIVKLCRMQGDTPSAGDEVARVAFVKNGESFTFRNLPEGKYYIEVAYGNNYSRNVKNKKLFRFTNDEYFVRLKEVLDFNLIREDLPDGRYKLTTPCYELELQFEDKDLEDGSSRKVGNRKISPDEFFKN